MVDKRVESVSVQRHVVLFTDVHDFSIVMKELGKNNTLGFLQEFYEKLGEIIVQHKGEIIKYLGDSILCIFQSGAEIEAVKCGCQMRKEYHELVQQRHITHATELEIGISSGVVEIGIIGHPTLKYKDVFGEAVNEAAMIGHHRGVAITEAVYQKVKNTFQTNHLPCKNLKWRDTPLPVWEVIENC